MMKKISITLLCISIVFIFSTLLMAHHPDTPAEIEGVSIVSAEEVKKRIVSNDAILIDSRKANHYVKGHIAKAVSIPFNWTTFGEIQHREGTYKMSKLPSDKNTWIIFYSDGEHNWDSYHSAKKAKSSGYKNVMWFKGGLKSWTANGYTLHK